MKLQELNNNELKNVNGGILGIGDDNSSITSVLTGFVNIAHTDEDGETESYNLDFGLGSLTNFMND